MSDSDPQPTPDTNTKPGMNVSQPPTARAPHPTASQGAAPQTGSSSAEDPDVIVKPGMSVPVGK